MDAAMMARGDGANAWGPAFRFLSRPASEGPFAPGSLRWYPRVYMIELVLGRILRAVRTGRRGAAFCLVAA